jgi:TFIIH basal transcription factor complex TTD-A subunit
MVRAIKGESVITLWRYHIHLKCIAGVLITTYGCSKQAFLDRPVHPADYYYRDPPVKQLILSMDEEKHFVIQDLDETHLLVSADSVDMIKEQLEEEVRHALPSSLPFCMLI